MREQQPHQQQTWRLEGDYFEACSCDSTCPCIFLADPDEGDCQLTLAWHVRRGHFGSTSLDGLNVAGVFHTPGNMVTGLALGAVVEVRVERVAARVVPLDAVVAVGVAGGA